MLTLFLPFLLHFIDNNVQTATDEGGHLGFQTPLQRVPPYVQRRRPTKLVGLHRGTRRHALRESHFPSQDQPHLRVPDHAPQNVLQNQTLPPQHPLQHRRGLSGHHQNRLEPNLDAVVSLPGVAVPAPEPER